MCRRKHLNCHWAPPRGRLLQSMPSVQHGHVHAEAALRACLGAKVSEFALVFAMLPWFVWLLAFDPKMMVLLHQRLRLAKASMTTKMQTAHWKQRSAHAPQGNNLGHHRKCRDSRHQRRTCPCGDIPRRSPLCWLPSAPASFCWPPQLLPSKLLLRLVWNFPSGR